MRRQGQPTSTVGTKFNVGLGRPRHHRAWSTMRLRTPASFPPSRDAAVPATLAGHTRPVGDRPCRFPLPSPQTPRPCSDPLWRRAPSPLGTNTQESAAPHRSRIAVADSLPRCVGVSEGTIPGRRPRDSRDQLGSGNVVSRHGQVAAVRGQLRQGRRVTSCRLARTQ